jgi:hypothetical protein
MPRNNEDFSIGKMPSDTDVKSAYSANKITLEEAHHLSGGNPDDKVSGNELGENYEMHAEGTPAGKRERSRKSARATHKNAGLTVHPRKGY